ncbi:MAG TPA: UDP-2,3-diacylglucosamine diphosphatase [Candidatus Macondimonas sp.]|nr:UDP-2,3-diacylglucosamine diphosphatase [Candidatus Macondimonas sp.]
MPATLLFSDVHLSPARPAIQDILIDLLQGDARRAAAVYILGDLFEYWVGDDMVPPEFMPVLDAIRALSASGVPVFLQHGNRDFLIGAALARRCGLQLLPDPALVTLHGRRVVLTHGDLLCTADVAYQRYRRVVHNRPLQRLFLALPRAARSRIAAGLRARTQQAVQGKPAAIMDVDPVAATALLDRFGADWLIHGHTHRPAIHRLDSTDNGRLRIDLGDWHPEGRGLWIDEEGPHAAIFPAIPGP